MLLALLDIQHYATRHHIDGVRQPSFSVIEVLLEVSADADARLGRTLVPMYRHHCSRFQGIEHPMAFILQRQMEAQTGRFPRIISRA